VGEIAAGYRTVAAGYRTHQGAKAR